MLSNVSATTEGLLAVIGVCALVAFAWCWMLNWSRYVDHKKAHINDADSAEKKITQEYALVPYLLLPTIWACISVFCALVLTDIAASRGYINGETEIMAVSAVISVVAYMVLDYFIVKKTGNAVYFETIEEAVVSKTGDAVEADLSVDEMLDKLLVEKISAMFKK